MNSLIKGLLIIIVIIKNLVVTENPLNIRNKSLTFKYKSFVYLTNKSIIIRYNDNRDEIA